MYPTKHQQDLIVIEGLATYERIIAKNQDAEPGEAIQNIQNFIKIYPEFARAHNDLAVHYYRTGNPLKALAHYEKANKLEPGNITFRKNLADFYFVELEWSDDATQTYLDILKDNPFDVETLNALGTISAQTGRKEQARQYFTRTLQLDTVNSTARQALQQLGELLPPPAQPAQLSSAFAPQPAHSFTPTLTASPAQPAPAPQPLPANPDDLYRQALEAANSGNRSEARRILEALVSSDPGYAIAHNDLGVICQQDGNPGKARRHYEDAVRLQPANATFRKNLADLLYIACGETEEALKLYLNVLNGNPRDIEVLKAISQICIESGKFDDARTFLENILKIEPWNQDARESLARLGGAGEPAQSSPSAPFDFSTPDQLYAEAQRLVTEDRASEALAVLEKLVRTIPDHAVAHNDMGVLRYQMGDREGARTEYERAVALQPANGNFRKNLADLYFAELGMTDEAIHIYLELFREQPRDVETLSGLGHICAAIGRPDEARSFYRKALEIEPWNADVRAGLSRLV